MGREGSRIEPRIEIDGVPYHGEAKITVENDDPDINVWQRPVPLRLSPVSKTITIKDPATYRQFADQVSVHVTIHMRVPYTGPYPRFALWGSYDRGAIQIGGPDDKWWQETLRLDQPARVEIPDAQIRLAARL